MRGTHLRPPRVAHAGPHGLVEDGPHGAVWITYRPDLGPDGVAALHGVVDAAGSSGLLSPLPEQSAPVVATAWGPQLTVEAADDPRLVRFAEQYAGGPQAPERGAACEGTTATRTD